MAWVVPPPVGIRAGDLQAPSPVEGLGLVSLTRAE